MVPKFSDSSFVQVAPKSSDFSTQPSSPAAIATPDPSSASDTPNNATPLQRVEVAAAAVQDTPESLL